MNIDFAAILVFLTALSGVIWGVDAVWFAKRRRAVAIANPSAGPHAVSGTTLAPQPSLIVDYARSFFPIFLVVLLLRSFLVEPFRIPSASMVPTLLEGDFILVNKFAFGIRLPVINMKIVEIGTPKRGDVIVFRPPHEPEKPYIKRVIGEPGDNISYRDKQLYINGEPIPLADLGTYVGIGAASTQTGAVLFAEDLMGVKHDVLERPIPSVYAVDDFTVPDHHYFVMGDNRDNSLDSRAWGTVPDENLMGKAFMIWMHWEGGLHFDFSRIGTKVD